MTIYVCDRCNAQIPSSEVFQIDVTSPKQDERWDLCTYCYEVFRLHFMTNTRVEPKLVSLEQFTK